MHNSYLDLNNSKGFHILCHAIGLDKAYVLARIHGWVSHNQNKEKRDAYADGHYWMFATMEELNIKYFPYLSRSALKRHIYSLEESGLLISDLHNRKKTSRKWYRINYDAVNALCENEMVKMTYSEIEMVNLTDSTSAECQNGTIAPSSLVQNEPSLGQNEPSSVISLVQNEPMVGNGLVQNEPSEQDENNISDGVWSKMNHSLVQNDPTIEIIKENINNLYFPLFGPFSPFTISSEDGQERELGIDDIDELQRRRKLLSELLNDFVPNNLGRGKLEDAVCKQMLRDLNDLRMLIERLTNDNPGSSTAVSAGDLVKKYGNPFAC